MIYYEARTTSQRKRFGIWWQRRISKIGVSWSNGIVNYYYINKTDYINAQSYEKSNRATIIETVFIAYYTVDNSQSTCLAKHWGKDGDKYAIIDNNEIFP